jgi:hypothetical protein
VVTAGYRMYDGGNEDLNTATYCTTAWVSGSYALTYCPQATTITINLGEFQGLTRSRWYDPSGGVYLGISGSPFRNSGSHNFAMPGNNPDGNQIGCWFSIRQRGLEFGLRSRPPRATQYCGESAERSHSGDFEIAAQVRQRGYKHIPSQYQTSDAHDVPRHNEGFSHGPSLLTQPLGCCDWLPRGPSADCKMFFRWPVGRARGLVVRKCAERHKKA